MRSRRKREVRAKTINVARLAKRDIDLGAALYPEQPGVGYNRPKTRGECIGAERPCPFVSCKHHLYLDVMENGATKINFPDLEVWDLPESCALDVADRGGIPGSGQGAGNTLEEVGTILNVTRERIRQVEAKALRHLKRMDRTRSRGALATFAGEGLVRVRRLPLLEEEDGEEPDEEKIDESL